MVKLGIQSPVLEKVTHSEAKQAFCFYIFSTKCFKALEAAVFNPDWT